MHERLEFLSAYDVGGSRDIGGVNLLADYRHGINLFHVPRLGLSRCKNGRKQRYRGERCHLVL